MSSRLRQLIIIVQLVKTNLCNTYNRKAAAEYSFTNAVVEDIMVKQLYTGWDPKA